MRRLPVYLLLDTSGSMSGEPIEAVKNGMKILHSALRKEPQAMEIAFLSVITFDSDVRQVVPLTELSSFIPPEVQASGGTSMGGALELVVQCADREVTKNTPQEKGDWKPLVFLMTDGSPTDNVAKALPTFKAFKWGTVVACGAGHSVDTMVLQDIAGANVLMLDVADTQSISAFFKYVSTSIAVSSKKLDSGGSELKGIGDLPPPPPEISLLKF
jgi:uncharacterized protein YegL